MRDGPFSSRASQMRRAGVSTIAEPCREPPAGGVRTAASWRSPRARAAPGRHTEGRRPAPASSPQYAPSRVARSAGSGAAGHRTTELALSRPGVALQSFLGQGVRDRTECPGNVPVTATGLPCRSWSRSGKTLMSTYSRISTPCRLAADDGGELVGGDPAQAQVLKPADLAGNRAAAVRQRCVTALLEPGATRCLSN